MKGVVDSCPICQMGIPNRVIVDWRSKFIAVDTRALLESQLGVKMTFIPAGEHPQNLVEQAHRMLWSTLGAIRIVSDITTWKTAVQEVVY